MIVMMAIMDRWFLWMWRMPISKHGCPPLLCTIDLSNTVKQTTVNTGGHQMKWKYDTTCCSECGLTGRDGMQKIVGIIGKIFCQTHTFAFIICLALSKQDEMYKKKSIWEIITFRIWPRNMLTYFSSMDTGGIFWKAVKTSLTTQTPNKLVKWSLWPLLTNCKLLHSENYFKLNFSDNVILMTIKPFTNKVVSFTNYT